METSSIRINLDGRSFDQLFEDKLANSKSNEAAYEAAENEHEKLTGHKRYSSYDSYRISRQYRHKKRKR